MKRPLAGSENIDPASSNQFVTPNQQSHPGMRTANEKFALVLLRHKPCLRLGGVRGAWQQGHRCRLLASATVRRWRRVAMEFGSESSHLEKAERALPQRGCPLIGSGQIRAAYITSGPYSPSKDSGVSRDDPPPNWRARCCSKRCSAAGAGRNRWGRPDALSTSAD